MTIPQIPLTGAPCLLLSCIQRHTDDWKLSCSLEALPSFSTWGGGLPVLDSVRTFYLYCFWEETHQTLHPSICFVRSFLVAFSCLILFRFTSLCLSVKTSFFICHFNFSISLLIFKISRSTSLREGMVHLNSLRSYSKVTIQGVMFNPPKP